MKSAAIGILLSGLAVGACNRADAPRTSGNVLATPADHADAARGDAPATATGTTPAGDARMPAAAPVTWREVVVPAGTTLAVVLEDAIGSDISRVEEPVHAHVTRAISIGGVTAIPEGSAVTGQVTNVERAAKVKGRAHVAFRFDSLTARGEDERYRIRTATVDRVAEATKKKDAVKILAPAAGGAIIGRIVGGRKGAAVGAAAGAGAGTAVVVSTRGSEVRLAKGAALMLRLAEPVTVKVRG